MLRRVVSAINLLFRQNSGSAAIEFGLIFPIVLALAFTVIDVGKMLIADSILQNAANSLTIQLRHKTAEERSEISLSNVEGLLREIVVARTDGWIDANSITVQILNLNQSDIEAPSGSTGEPITYIFTYLYQSSTPISVLFGNQNSVIRSVEITFQNGSREVY